MYASRPYTIRMLDGECLRVCEETSLQLSDVEQLQYCEFNLPANVDIAALSEVQIAKDDEVAATFAAICDGINVARFRRLAKFLLSWSSRCAYFTTHSDKAVDEVQDMRIDYDNYEEVLKPSALTVPGVKDILCRSPRETMPEQQVYEVVRYAGFYIPREVGEFLTQQPSRL